MKTLRFINQLTVLLAAYTAGLVICRIPYAWAVALAVIVGMASKKGYQLSSHGTARWATRAQLRERGMLDG
jgi:hypothetical protein